MEKPGGKDCWRCGGWMPSETCKKCEGLVVWQWEQWQEYKEELTSEITKLAKTKITKEDGSNE